MTPERWQKLSNVLYQALELAPGDRSAFLDRACASDSALRRELESLLSASDEMKSSFLKSSSLAMAIKPGTRLDDYEVETLLGTGGMGEVYRARVPASNGSSPSKFYRGLSRTIRTGCVVSRTRPSPRPR